MRTAECLREICSLRHQTFSCYSSRYTIITMMMCISHAILIFLRDIHLWDVTRADIRYYPANPTWVYGFNYRLLLQLFTGCDQDKQGVPQILDCWRIRLSAKTITKEKLGITCDYLIRSRASRNQTWSGKGDCCLCSLQGTIHRVRRNTYLVPCNDTQPRKKDRKPQYSEKKYWWSAGRY